MKVFVGLSGGVDSAVSAALLKEQGHDVTGVFIYISIPGYPCSAGEDKLSAQRVAAHLKIPFREIDLSKEYRDDVFAYTLREFAAGRTPNPDTLCNQKIKFGSFFDWCMQTGADMVATGHYARVKHSEQGSTLLKGADEQKDQSYFLWMVPEAALKKTLFPIGAMQKTQVRALAKKCNLPNAARKDSQGLCFLGDISIESMLMRELKPRSGNVLDEQGSVVGEHDGAALYTLGQRHGFRLHTNSTHSAAHFVVAKDVEHNTITISPSREPQGERTVIKLADANWIGPFDKNSSLTARFRYRGALIPAKCNGETVELGEARYVPVGQSLVLYDNERCVGGAIVDSAQVF